MIFKLIYHYKTTSFSKAKTILSAGSFSSIKVASLTYKFLGFLKRKDCSNSSTSFECKELSLSKSKKYSIHRSFSKSNIF